MKIKITVEETSPEKQASWEAALAITIAVTLMCLVFVAFGVAATVDSFTPGNIIALCVFLFLTGSGISTLGALWWWKTHHLNHTTTIKIGNPHMTDIASVVHDHLKGLQK